MTKVMTATGPVESTELGFVLPHEHVFMNLLKEYREDGLLNDYDLMVAELREFARVGGGTIVDCTTRGLHPTPELVARASEDSGIKIVLGCGYYRDPYIESGWLDPRSVSAIADELIEEINEGFGSTGIRPGIIGEIGADRWYISALEERSFRAAARTQKATGLTISTHAARWPVGLLQLDLLEEEGVSPLNVIIGHCDTVPSFEYHLQIARRGAYVQFDTIRGKSDYDMDLRVRYVVSLIDNGFCNQILLSHDVCQSSHVSALGGGGYTLIANDFMPRLRAAGVSEDLIRQITQSNPQRALTGAGLVRS